MALRNASRPGACPSCGHAPLTPAGQGAPGRRAVCDHCGRCWELTSTGVTPVDTLACPGCAHRTVCESRPTSLVVELSTTHQLPDGSHVLIRPLLYSDRNELALGYQKLSVQARRLRFFSAHAALSADELEYLTNLDFDKHAAVGAFALDEPGHPGIGVARYIRHGGDPSVAEVAVTVLDQYQGRGVATLLVSVLADIAVAHGVRRFVSYVLWENFSAIEPLRELGARISPAEPGVACVELDLAEDVATRDSLVGRMLSLLGTLTGARRTQGRTSA